MKHRPATLGAQRINVVKHRCLLTAFTQALLICPESIYTESTFKLYAKDNICNNLRLSSHSEVL